MTVGLDLGASEFRCLRREQQQLVGRRVPASYALIRTSPAHLRLLEQSEAKFAKCGEYLVPIGESVAEWAELLRIPALDLLPGGQLPATEPVARQLLSVLLDAVLPPATDRTEICCLTLPGEHTVAHTATSREYEFFTHLVRLRGYQPQLTGQALALILAELGQRSFSGLGISLGKQTCDVSLAHNGREFARCVTSCDWPANGATEMLDGPVLCETLTELLTDVRDELLRNGALSSIRQPINLVVGGAIVQRVDFAAIWDTAWKRAGWPLAVAHRAFAKNPQYAVARGCLIQAELERQAARGAA